MQHDQRGLWETFVGDGRSLISFCGICLALAGLFAIFQSLTGHFLPHDVEYLQMPAEELCSINECRIVHFMIHDRISFGGSLVAIAILYMWLAEFPLKHGQHWAWWTVSASGVAGFGSFLTYLGYGYLDTWHGAATLVLLPCFAGGLWLQRSVLKAEAVHEANRPWTERFSPAEPLAWKSRRGLGHLLLLASACGTVGGGLTIQYIGMTSVFVDTDLTFMGLDRQQLNAINPRLIPLIAHDRAGFGGALTTVGLLTVGSLWFSRLSRSLWQTLLLGGVFGWTTAILVHPAIGYTDLIHLSPAVAGACLFAVGLFLTRPQTCASDGAAT